MGGLHFPVTGDNKDFIRALRESQAEVRRTADVVESSGVDIGEVFNQLKGAALGVSAAFGARELVSNVIRVRGEFQQLEVSFTTMLGSAEKANSLMIELTKTAAITPFGLQDVAGGAKQLLAYGLASEKVNETLIRLGDIAAGLSIPLNDLVYLYGTTMTQGQLFTQDLRQFMGRGIPLADELAKQFGVTKDKVGELVTAGRVGFKEVEKAIISMTSEGGKFGGLMEAQSKTIVGQLSNIEDAIDVMFNEIGKSTEGVINESLSIVSSLVENYERVGRILINLVGVYGVYRTACMTTVAIQNIQAASTTRLTAAHIAHHGWLVLTEKAQKMLNATMLKNPYVLAAVAIAGVVAALMSMKSETELLKEAEEEYDQNLSNIIEKEKERKRAIEGLISIAEDENMSSETRLDAIKKLVKEYPQIFAKYETEVEWLNNIKEIKKEIAELEAEQSAENAKNELKYIDAEIKRLEALSNEQIHDIKHGEWKVGENGKKYKTSYRRRGLTDEEEARLNVLKKKRTEVAGRMKSEEANAYFSDLAGIDNDTLETKIREREELLALLKLMNADAKGDTKSIGEALFTGIYDQKELEWQLLMLQNEKSKREQERKTSKEWVKSLKENYDNALKAYNDFVNNQKNKLDKPKFEEEAKKLKQALDAAKNELDKYQPVTDSYAKKTEESQKRMREAEEKANEMYINLLRSNQESRTATMQEGQQKKLKQIDDNYQEEKDKIDKLERELKEQNKKAGKSETLTTDQSEAIAESRFLAEQKMLKEKEKVNKEYDKKRVQAERELLKTYGDYAQQRLAITTEYAEKISKVDTDEEKTLLTKKMEDELDELDIRFGKTTSALADLFEDSSKKSVLSIQQVIDKYEALLSFRKGEGNISKEELFELGITEKDIEFIEQGKISLKELADAIEKLKGEMANRSAFQKFSKDIQDAVEKLKKGDIAGGIENIGNAVTEFTPALKQFSSELANIFSYDDDKVQRSIDAVTGLGQAAAGVGQAMSGDIVGGIMNAVGGVSQVVTALDGMFGADHSEFLSLQEQYNNLIDVWDVLISKKKEYISTEYGQEAQRAGKEALELIDKEIEATRKLGKSWLKQGKSIGSRSYERRMSRDMTKEGWDELRKYNTNYLILGRTAERFDWLFDMSGEQLDDLRKKAPEFWAGLKADAREYLEIIIAGGEEAEKIREQMREAATGISFDSFRDNFVSILTDMDSSAKDFADDISEYLYNAMMNSIVAEKYEEALRNLYLAWSEDMQDNGRLDKSVDEYRQEAERIATEALEERNQWASLLNYTAPSSRQEASSNGFQAMSQDTGDELNGRFTALQISGESVKNSMLSVVSQMAELSTMSAENNGLLSQIRDHMITSNVFLENIDITTKAMLKDFAMKLGTLVANTKTLV